MILTKNKSIEDLVVEFLAKNPYITGPNLVDLVQSKRSHTTKQAVYAALRLLAQSEAIAKAGGKYYVSRVWIQRVYELFDIQKKRELIGESVFALKEGKSFSYKYPNLAVCDTYWAHLFKLLTDWIPAQYPIFAWHPHPIFSIWRRDIEVSIFAEFERENKYCYFISGGNTRLDQQWKRTWGNKCVALNNDIKSTFPNNYFLNVFQDFVIEVHVDQRLANLIDKFFQKYQKLDEKNTTEFESYFDRPYPVRIKISRKKKKAALLRKKLAKDFYIPKHLKID